MKTIPVQKSMFDVMEAVVRRGRAACRLLYHSLEMCSPLPLDRALGYSGQIMHPSGTTLIINISNSTLVDCAIGNSHYPPAVVEKQPLLLNDYIPVRHEDSRCSCFCGHTVAAQPPLPPPLPPASAASIQVHSSHLNCVIIGDNNYMH
ncbi:hypothetical protein CRUP_019337, partial [Coryphaenoides rupestris]